MIAVLFILFIICTVLYGMINQFLIKEKIGNVQVAYSSHMPILAKGGQLS